ncbi:hypothetical protein [uncultured Kordia sp.]|nr:hypothetical protein [uncultured Kordia sp.]
MLENILKLKGVNALTKIKQNQIVGQFSSRSSPLCQDGSCNSKTN